jgi:ribosomal protein S18 acetylase RimI-like enzyme
MFDFIPIDETGLKEYESWFSDSELRRRIERPTSNWFHYVRNEPGVYAWLIYAGGIPAGVIQFDAAADQTGSFSIAVKPRLRSRGVGKRIVRAFLARPEVLQLRRLTAGVKHDNVPAQRCLRAAGFTQQNVNPDNDGFLAFIYEPKYET